MLDIKRKVPRFDIDFKIVSNNLEGVGINISQKGMAFLTENQLEPADNILFKTEIKGYIFSDKIYKIQGKGRLLYSRPTKTHRENYYNGFEFIKFASGTKKNLLELLADIRQYTHRFGKEPEQISLSRFMYYPSSDLFCKTDFFYDAFNKKDTKLFEMFSYYLDSPSSPYPDFVHLKTKNKKNMIMMGSNNYLGLTTNKDVIEASCQALRKYGTGNGSGAMVGGTLSIHKQLEEEIADFVGKEAAIVYNSGYSTNLGTISGLLRPHDVVINDFGNHASIFDGCSLSGAKILVFSHNDVMSLEKVLKRAKTQYNGILIIVDGIYSTDGTITPLPEIVKLARKYEAKVMVDEAHGFGILGEKGIGATESYNLVDKVDIIMATMSKSLAGVGGFVAASKEVVQYLRFYAHSYLFSTGIPPAVAGGILKALDILRNDSSIREKLLSNAEFFKKGLLDIGLNIGDPKAAVVPVFIPDLDLLMRVSAKLYEKGVFHNVMGYPAVPMGGSLLRFGIMANHTEKELKTALDAIGESAKEEGLLEYYKEHSNS